MSVFIFESYTFDETTAAAEFFYEFEGRRYKERLEFTAPVAAYNNAVFERALFLAFLLVGVSYYKAFPVQDIELRVGQLDQWQANFFDYVYQEGLSQFAYENSLRRDSLAHFQATTDEAQRENEYEGEGILALQSGGKDSLLTAALLEDKGVAFDSLYITSGETHPSVLDGLKGGLHTVFRQLDRIALRDARSEGGLNGHVPVTYIVLATALVQAILLGRDTILASIGHEGEEPHAMIEDLPVNHQWSKTWLAEQLFADYVKRYVSTNIRIGSPLRHLSELSISQLFAQKAWERFGSSFSSCNVANYAQGADNTQLSWCGKCPKCANAYLLFSPFIDHSRLTSMFEGQDLFEKAELQETFKGLLGVDGVMKPFECVGEIEELRFAYHLSSGKGFARLSFEVPLADFDATRTYDSQPWARQLLESTPATI